MTVLPVSSDYSPALITFHEELHIGWTAKYELHVMTSETGEHWANDSGLNEYSYHGPALAVFRDRLFIAWTGTDEFALLNVASSQFGENFINKVTLREDSAYGPALEVFNDRLFLAWTGTDEQRSLNVISSVDGVHFSDKRILGQSSIGSPALAATQPGDDIPALLFIAWTAPDESLHIGGTDDGLNFDFGGSQIGQEKSFAGPALLPWSPAESGTAVLNIAWTGVNDDHNLNLMASTHVDQLGAGFEGKAILEDTSIAGPSLASFTHDSPFNFIA